MSSAGLAALSTRALTDVVSEEVRVLLARRDLRTGVLAPVLGISQQAVSKKMRGVTAWSLEDLDILARYFGVDANTLLPDLGKQGVSGVDAGSVLPHLDSNQEPAGLWNLLVNGHFLSVVEGGVSNAQSLVASETATVRHRHLWSA